MVRKVDPLVFLFIGAVLCVVSMFTCFRAVKDWMPQKSAYSEGIADEFGLTSTVKLSNRRLTVSIVDSMVPADTSAQRELARRIADWAFAHQFDSAFVNGPDATPDTLSLISVTMFKFGPGSMMPRPGDLRYYSFSVADLRQGISCNSHRITGNGIGALRIGMSADQLVSRCNVTSDTTMQGNEGMPVRVWSVAINADTPYVEIANDRVFRILVRSQGLFTEDSLSVGSSVVTLAGLPGAKPIVGEGYVYVTSTAHCGLSFRISAPPASVPRGDWSSVDLAKLEPTVHVTRILVNGCNDSLPR